MRIHPLRGLLVCLIAVGLLLAVVAAFTGLLLVLAVVLGLGVLNVVYLPRAAVRLRIPVGWLALMLIPFMILAGVVVGGGVEGAGWGAGVWLVAIGLPRAIGREVARRARRRFESRLGYVDVEPRSAAAEQARTPTERPGGRPLPPADDRGRGEFVP
jgi:hypothetical protein